MISLARFGELADVAVGDRVGVIIMIQPAVPLRVEWSLRKARRCLYAAKSRFFVSFLIKVLETLITSPTLRAPGKLKR